MKTTRFIFFFILLASIIFIAGCVSTTNPLTGWKSYDGNQLNQTIKDDYQDYIQRLPPKKWQFLDSVQFFQDDTGQKAVSITTGVNGTWWKHVLIYDKDSKRIKVIKYSTGHYAS